MGAQGTRGAGNAPGPRFSSSCLTHPHGGNGGGGPRLLLPTLAGREAATVATAAAATPEQCVWRGGKLDTAHAPSALPRAPWSTPRLRRAGKGGVRGGGACRWRAPGAGRGSRKLRGGRRGAVSR